MTTETIRRYTATIRHHSLSRVRVINAGSTLRGAKRRATQEFGDGFQDHTIVIFDIMTWGAPIAATRRIGDCRWTDLA